MYEYKVIPAPGRVKTSGEDTARPEFSHLVEASLNEVGSDGWEYFRAEAMPLAGRNGTTKWRNILIFRRPTKTEEIAPAPQKNRAMPMLVLTNPVTEGANLAQPVPKDEQPPAMEPTAVEEPEAPEVTDIIPPNLPQRTKVDSRQAHLQILRNVETLEDDYAEPEGPSPVPFVLRQRANRQQH